MLKLTKMTIFSLIIYEGDQNLNGLHLRTQALSNTNVFLASEPPLYTTILGLCHTSVKLYSE